MAVRSGQFFWLLAFALLAQAPGWAADRERQGQALRSAGAADRDWIANLVPSQACAGDQVHTSTGDINLDLSCNINETNRDSQSGRGVSAVSEVNSGDSGTVDVKFTGSVTGDKRYSAGLYVLSDTDNGNSGDVKVDFDGDVGVGGYESRGVYAASWSGEVWGSSDGIGSSGDVDVSFDGVLNGGNPLDSDLLSSSRSVGLFAESQSWGGGDAGNINVEIKGEINTTQHDVHALRALTFARGDRNSSNPGDSGDITVNVNGPINVKGGGSRGLYLSSGESIYGNSHYSYGDSGNIDLSVIGDITTRSDFDPFESRSRWMYSVENLSAVQAFSVALHGSPGDIKLNLVGNLDVVSYEGAGVAALTRSAGSWNDLDAFPAQAPQIDITHKGNIKVDGEGASGLSAGGSAVGGYSASVNLDVEGDIIMASNAYYRETTALYAHNYNVDGPQGADPGTMYARAGDLSIKHVGNITFEVRELPSWGDAEGFNWMRGITAISTTRAYGPGSSGDIFLDLNGDYTDLNSSNHGISNIVYAHTSSNSGSSGDIVLSHKGDVDISIGMTHGILLESIKERGSYQDDISASGSVAVNLEGNHVYRNEVSDSGTCTNCLSGIYASSDISANYNNHSLARTGGPVSVNLKGSLTSSGSNMRGLTAKTSSEYSTSHAAATLGDVSVAIVGDVSTSGANSKALELISTTAYGQAGNIVFDLEGNLTATGAGSRGVEAKSESSAGNASDVDVKIKGDVLATSHQAKAVVAESSAPAGTAGNISVVLAPGSTIQTNASGTAVQMIGGASNRLINRGRISARGPSSAAPAPVIKAASVATASSTEDASANGFAIVSTTGNDTIINAPGGVIEGTVNLGSGVNQLENQAGAQLISSGELYVGPTAQSVFRNAGVLLSAADQPAVYNLSGSYVQTASAEMRPELDFATLSMDVIDVAFDATLAGTVDLSTTNPELIRPGYYQVPLVRAGSVVNDGLRLEVDSSAIARYSLGFSRTAATVDLDVNFAGFGALNDNQESIGRYLNRVQAYGSSPALAGLITDLFRLPGLAGEQNLAAAYNSLSSEVYTTSFTNLKFAFGEFIDTMMTCPETSVENGFIAEGECVWAVGQGLYYSSEGGSDYFGFDSTTGGISVGAQFDLGSDYYLGFSVGRNSYSSSISSGPGSASRVTAGTTGRSWQGGAALKKVMNKTKLALAFAGGKANFDAYRNNIFSSLASASGEQSIDYWGVEFRAAHDIELSPSTYLRPGISVAYQGMDQAAFAERGAKYLGLSVDSAYQGYGVVSPSLELGHEFKVNATTFRPMLSVGYAGYYGGSSVRSTLLGANQGLSSFRIEGLSDQNYVSANAGVGVIFENGMSVSITYDSLYASSSELQGGQVRFTVPF